MYSISGAYIAFQRKEGVCNLKAGTVLYKLHDHIWKLKYLIIANA